MKNWKSDFEMLIQFALEDFENKVNDAQVTENKLVILFEQERKKDIKHYRQMWLFIGIVLGIVIIRILQFILPHA